MSQAFRRAINERVKRANELRDFRPALVASATFLMFHLLISHVAIGQFAGNISQCCNGNFFAMVVPSNASALDRMSRC